MLSFLIKGAISFHRSVQVIILINRSFVKQIKVTEGRKNQRPEGSEIPTFPVPFLTVQSKESISVSTNNSTKISKEEIISQAFKFHSVGNLSEALKSYQYFIKQGFKDHRIFTNYGNILKDLGNLQDAELYTRKAIELKPDSAVAHSNLGNILGDLGNLQDAEIYTRKAIALNPKYANAHYNLGNILRNLGNLQDAELSIRKAIKLNPNFAVAYSNLGAILMEIGKLKEAEIIIRKAIEINPDFSYSHLNLGNVLNSLGKLEEAEKSTRKAIELKPNCVSSHIRLGAILCELGKQEEANIHEWKAIELNTLSPILKNYRENSKLINKTAFWVFSCSVFNQFQPIIEINPNSFEILVPNNIKDEVIIKIRNSIKNKDIRIRTINDLIENNLIYEKLISIHGDDEFEYITNKNNIKNKIIVPTIKLLGKKNIRFMYTAGKSKYTIYSFWNKYYDGILCYGTYHEDKFKIKHKIATAQMGYPRFDRYFKPGIPRDYLIKKFKCDPKKRTIVWLPTWTSLSSIDKYYKVISSLKNDYNIVIRPHPSFKSKEPEIYKKLFTVDFNYIDQNADEDNVPLYVLADLMLFDYGGPMFGALYLNKNFAFLEMDLEAKNHLYLGKMSSEDYFKSFFPDRIAKPKNLKFICNYCLNNPPSNSVVKSLREEFFNLNYQGNSAKRAYELLNSNHWL